MRIYEHNLAWLHFILFFLIFFNENKSRSRVSCMWDDSHGWILTPVPSLVFLDGGDLVWAAHLGVRVGGGREELETSNAAALWRRDKPCLMKDWSFTEEEVMSLT